MAQPAEHSPGAAGILQIFYASGRVRLCPDAYDLGKLHFPEKEAVTALEELRVEGLLGPDERDDVLELTRRGRCLVQEAWHRGQLPDLLTRRRVVGHFSGEWDLPVRIALSVNELFAIVPRTVSLERDLRDEAGGFSAWEFLYPLTGQPENGILVGLRAPPGKDAEQIGDPNDELICFWLSVDRKGKVRERPEPRGDRLPHCDGGRVTALPCASPPSPRLDPASRRRPRSRRPGSGRASSRRL